MMPFSTGLGWSVLGVVKPEIGLPLGWSAGSGCDTAGLLFLNVAILYKKNKKEEGSAGASPIAAPMPKSIPR